MPLALLSKPFGERTKILDLRERGVRPEGADVVVGVEEYPDELSGVIDPEGLADRVHPRPAVPHRR